VFEQHFGLSATPFRKDVPAMALFPARRHQQLLQRLDYALAPRQIACLCGETGSGKSTLLRALCAQQVPAHYRFVTLAHPPRQVRELHLEILAALGADTPWTTAEMRTRVRHQLTELAEAGRTPVLVVDEAQDLSPAVLEELRLLTAFDLDGRPVFALVLSGHPELARHLRRKGLEPFAQRIGLWFQLVGLDRDETGRYLQHHLELAGCPRALFQPAAVTAIFEVTKGLPRAINRLATASLALAAARGDTEVDAPLVETAAAEWD
jgi:general secretion pathway protein A